MRSANRDLSVRPCGRGGDGEGCLGGAITFRADIDPLAELRGELAASVESVGGSFGQRGRQHLIEVRQFRVPIAELWRYRGEVLTDDNSWVGILIRRRPGQQVKRGGGQCVLVGAPVNVLA